MSDKIEVPFDVKVKPAVHGKRIALFESARLVDDCIVAAVGFLTLIQRYDKPVKPRGELPQDAILRPLSDDGRTIVLSAPVGARIHFDTGDNTGTFHVCVDDVEIDIIPTAEDIARDRNPL